MHSDWLGRVRYQSTKHVSACTFPLNTFLVLQYHMSKITSIVIPFKRSPNTFPSLTFSFFSPYSQQYPSSHMTNDCNDAKP